MSDKLDPEADAAVKSYDPDVDAWMHYLSRTILHSNAVDLASLAARLRLSESRRQKMMRAAAELGKTSYWEHLEGMLRRLPVEME